MQISFIMSELPKVLYTGIYPITLGSSYITFIIYHIYRGGIILTNYYQFTPSIPVVGQQAINPNDQRFFPFLGLGLGFLGGLATGALLAPGPGFGFAPGVGFGGPGPGFGFAPGLGFGGPGSGFGFAPGLGFGGPGSGFGFVTRSWFWWTRFRIWFRTRSWFWWTWLVLDTVVHILTNNLKLYFIV